MYKFNTLAAAVLAIILASAAIFGQAQDFDSAYTVDLKANDFSSGTLGKDAGGTDMRFGYSFVGRADGKLSGSFFLSLNTLPGTYREGSQIEFTGGTWAFPVYTTSASGIEPIYRGTIYGVVDKGSTLWNGTFGTTTIEMSITGGTDDFKNAVGHAFFDGRTFRTKGKRYAIEGKFSVGYNTVVQ